MRWLILLALTACSCTGKIRNYHMIGQDEIRELATKCADDMVNLYGDLGAESSSGYEEMAGSDAHFEGVKWASDYIKGCVQ